jgi:hypothetical protein
MTAQEFIFLNLVRAAARGDTRAIQTLFSLRERYQDTSETALDLAELGKEDQKILEEYFAMLPAKDPGDASDPSTSETDQDADESKTTDDQPTGKANDADGGES